MALKFIIAVKKDDYKRSLCNDNAPLIGTLKFGWVGLHREHLKEDEYCMGGGAYSVDEENKKLILDGESIDFGQPRFDEVDSVTCPKCFEGYEITYTAPKRWYDDAEPTTINVNEHISAFVDA